MNDTKKTQRKGDSARRVYVNKRGDKILRRIADACLDILHQADVDDLKACIQAMGELTQTNCGWAQYRLVKEGVDSLAKTVLHDKQSAQEAPDAE